MDEQADTPRDITTLTETELKVLVYDCSREMQRLQNIVQAANDRIEAMSL